MAKLASKAGATSSHTIKAKGGCLQHNRREYHAPNIVNSLSNLNESWESDDIKGVKSIRPLERKAAKLYTDKVKQKCQSSFAPYKESVVVCRNTSTMEQAKDFARLVEETIPGIKCVGIWMHKDEGYQHTKYIEGNEDFKTNNHVHYLWYCQNPQTGKAIPIKKADMRKMQDCAANAFGMERGNAAEETGRKWREANEQRKYAAAKQLESIQTEITEMEGKLAELSSEKEQAEKRVKALTTMVANLNDRLLDLEGEIAKREIALEDTEDLQKQHEELVGKLEDKKQKLQAAHDKLWDLSDQFKNILDRIEDAKGQLSDTRRSKETEETELNEISKKREEEENRLAEVQKDLAKKDMDMKQIEKELHILTDKGEKVFVPTVVESYEYLKVDFPSISVKEIPTFNKKEWVDKKNETIEKKCRCLVDKARKPLEEQINEQNDKLEKMHGEIDAERRLRKKYEDKYSLNAELNRLAQYAGKAIVDYITSDKKAEDLRRQLLWTAKQAVKAVFEHAFKIEPYDKDINKAIAVTIKGAYSILYEFYKLVENSLQREAGRKLVEDTAEEQVDEIGKDIQKAKESIKDERSNVGVKR